MFRRFAKSIDINDKDPVVHKHTPYIVVLVRLAEKWADAHDGNMPSTRQEKKEFKVHLLVLFSHQVNELLSI
jgi:NEDD8-activating enzyme E1 regulatory subunit